MKRFLMALLSLSVVGCSGGEAAPGVGVRTTVRQYRVKGDSRWGQGGLVKEIKGTRARLQAAGGDKWVDFSEVVEWR